MAQPGGEPYIWITPRRMGGEPCISGTRIPVGTILAQASTEDAVVNYGVTVEEVELCRWFAGRFTVTQTIDEIVAEAETGYDLPASASARRSHYFSTYCLHGRHGDCRLTCKTCDAPCRCECHDKGGDQ